MASRVVHFWKSVASRAGAHRRLATASAAPRVKPFAPTADTLHHADPPKLSKINADFIPIYVTMGFVVLVIGFAAHTAKQQIAYNPGVRFHKKRREAVSEVDEPDRALKESGKFLNKNFFRKVAHIQDFDAVRSGTSDPARADPFAAPRAETLKSVGVNPGKGGK